MAQKGLSREVLIDTAVNVIERYGRNNFSMKLVADKLGVKTASLYNHVKNMGELLAGVCNYALRLQKDAEMQAIENLNRRQAVYALAEAYRRFAKEHRELYWLVMNVAASDSHVLDEAAMRITEPIVKMLADYDIEEDKKIHFRRFFRSIVHGYVSEMDAGFFSHSPADTDKTFHFAIECFVDSLDRAEKRRH
ncbi:MAG: TetR/AcrR family transcriptional regulator [Clostridiales bacterium]|jgi:AcrR family transcriptional regulator|nr:TetR/AcrR family transcriptional regulator [Clostridiales bacterium]MCI2160380.1 TetR/AcrR family transcriptional regulator [Oscillospiraceae bacterium]MCI1961798.1 TetR/AcrR family transcriptional regulator [Clostridiales bacterium]MCI2022469.1 TetR/AcrR family transcriptional regulator [Clostridiales bacterium]MCI2026866.1 TetR/AcrR family transcriptional regulator [Clostridiales bacterium]